MLDKLLNVAIAVAVPVVAGLVVTFFWFSHVTATLNGKPCTTCRVFVNEIEVGTTPYWGHFQQGDLLRISPPPGVLTQEQIMSAVNDQPPWVTFNKKDLGCRFHCKLYEDFHSVELPVDPTGTSQLDEP